MRNERHYRFNLFFMTLLMGLVVGCAEETSPTFSIQAEDVTEREGPALPQEDVTFPRFDGGRSTGTKDAVSSDSQDLKEDAMEGGDVAEVTDATPIVLPTIVITEIMMNPESVNDGSGEWLELTNMGDEDVDLEGWVLRDESAGGHTLVGSLAVAAGSSVVLGCNGVLEENGGIVVDYVYPYAEFILANVADQVILEWQGTVVDAVAYAGVEAGWPEGNGVSLSLSPDAYGPFLNDDGANWCNAPLFFQGADKGSAGDFNPSCDAEPESACDDSLDNDGDGLVDCADMDCGTEPACSPFQVGSIVITEFMANPSALSDGEGEWFELFNASDKTLDLRDLVIDDGSGDGHTIVGETPLEVSAGGYAIIGASDGAVEGGVAYVWGSGFGSLKNTTGAIVVSYGGLDLDRVEWSPDNGFITESGVAYSLSPASLDSVSNDLAVWWCLATEPMLNGDFGTPGTENGACPEPNPCGNTLLDEGEDCDDGNAISGDGCEPDCTNTPPLCGDGNVDEGEDCDDANTDSGDGCSSVCVNEIPVPVGALVFSEFLYDPSEVEDSNGEWFELYNPGTAAISLNGWTVLDGGGEAFVLPATPSLVVEPGDYFVMGRNGNIEENGGVEVDFVYGSDLTLPNTQGTVALAWVGVEIDRVTYAIPPFPTCIGTSLQLSEESLDASANEDPLHWCSSEIALGVDFTPGQPNGSCVTPIGTCGDNTVQSYEGCDDGNQNDGDGCEANCTPTPIACGNGLVQGDEECDDGNEWVADGCEPDCTFTPAVCGNEIAEQGEECDDGNEEDGDGCEGDCTLTEIQEGDVVITEIMRNPSAVLDSVGEWFEIKNMTGMTLSLEGWLLDDLGSNSHIISLPMNLEAGAYAVFAASDSSTNGGVDADYVYDGFTLGNSTDEIRLTTPDGLVVDLVVYQNDTFPSESGVAMSLDPEFIDSVANDDGGNWCGAINALNGVGADLGSPGFENPSCSQLISCGDAVCDGDLGENCGNCSGDCGLCTSCDVGLAPGCPECPCESCVCALDPTCCSGTWTEECAAMCSGECGGEVCPLTGCIALELPGAGGASCEACVCALDSACCDVAWDDDCATLCAGSCDQDCGALDGCSVSQYPGTDGASCESCVCSQNPDCCETAWGVECVQLCDLCGGGCLSDGCESSELADCNACECKNCVCGEDPSCCDVAWDQQCAVSCETCGQDCGSDGCTPSVKPGCDGCECEDAVCALNPSCCSESWDFSCASLCIQEGQDCGSAGCDPTVETGCDGCLCESCVCDQDPSCCAVDGSWTESCALLCEACGQPCLKDGCEESAFIGCKGCACETCVCDQDTTCCDVAWDAECTLLCSSCGTECGFACGNGVVDPGEACDAGENNSDIVVDACRTSCVEAGCGDLVMDSGELCDDGNQTPGDGCSDTCQIEANSPGVGDLVITEIMYNPISIVDGLGEWFEFWNTTGETLNLSGVTLRIEDVSWTLPEGTLIEPSEYFLAAIMLDFGLNGNLSPDGVFAQGALLPNVDSGTVALELDGVVLDTVTYDFALFPVASGTSLSLDPLLSTANANDQGSAWCVGTNPYGSSLNLGTPGTANTPCPLCGDQVCGEDETCDSCPEDCGGCDTGCAPSLSPGCGGCSCEEAVCDSFPECCTEPWNSDCVAACDFLSGCAL